MDDQTILDLIRTGKNDLALNALYRNFPSVRKLIRSKGGSAKDAEDIFQEALLILLQNIQKDFHLSAQLSTYLYSVCRYLWNDQRRRTKPSLPIDTDTGLNPAEEIQIRAALEKESRIRLAEQALGDLKERCRELLLLFYDQANSLKEIAGKMGYGSEASAKNQKYKCLEAARTRLKELQQQTQTF